MRTKTRRSGRANDEYENPNDLFFLLSTLLLVTVVPTLFVEVSILISFSANNKNKFRKLVHKKKTQKLGHKLLIVPKTGKKMKKKVAMKKT